MLEFVSQLINGLAIGNVYALLALGYTLVFGVARLINFAQGSVFMFGAYIAWTAVALWNLPLGLAFALAVLCSTLLGLLMDAVALRPLQKGPQIAPLLSTLALSIILDRAAELLWSPATRSFPSPLAGTVWRVGGAFISAVDVVIFAAGLLTMAGLAWFLKSTWTGKAIRATAQDPEAAQQVGIDVARVRRLTFGLAAGLGGTGGVLVGMYYQSIFPSMGLPYGLKGFAAALLGGITSTPGAVAGGMLLGIFESLASAYAGTGYRDLVAYVLLMLVLLWRPRGLFGDRRLDGLGGSQAASGAVPGTSPLASAAAGAAAPRFTLRPRASHVAAALALAALLPLATRDFYALQVAVTAVIFGTLALSLTLISGSAGQISLGHAALFGVGAYTTAILARNFGLPSEVVLAASGLLAAAAGVLTSLPTLRLSGHTVVVATLAVGQIVHLVFLNWISVTRGPMGIPGIPAPEFAVAARTPLWDLSYHYWLALAVLAVALFIGRRLLTSPMGRAWRAIREDRLAAQAAGIPASRYLSLVYGVGGFLAGLAGSLYAYLLSFVSPDSFYTDTSILVLTMAVLGGLGNLAGAVIGGAALASLPELFRPLADYRLIVYGLVLLVCVRFRPQGIGGTE